MPRSGTSLLAGIFGRRGYFLGDAAALHAGDDHNPSGYWEAKPLIEANVALLARAGFDAHNTWLFRAITDTEAQRISRLTTVPTDIHLVARFRAQRPWIWKDPRLCYTLGYWWPLLDPATTRVLLVTRDPRSIWRSFVRLGWRDNSEANRRDVHDRVDAHIHAARRAIEGLSIPHLNIDYDRLLAEPDAMAERLAEFLDTPFTARDFDLHPELNHASVRGRFGVAIATLATRFMPPGMRAGVKRWLPRRIVVFLLPERGL